MGILTAFPRMLTLLRMTIYENKTLCPGRPV
jgi:hypothetical protein